MTKQPTYQTKFHFNGDVTVWSVYLQQWVRFPADNVSDETMATLPRPERERIMRIGNRTPNLRELNEDQ